MTSDFDAQLPDGSQLETASRAMEAKKKRFGSQGLKEIAAVKRAVRREFARLFRADQIRKLDAPSYSEFLKYKNNRITPSLYFQGGRVVKDMPRLQNALAILLDESRSIVDRFDDLFPKGESSIVPKFGKAQATTVLQVAFPAKYGIYSGQSEAGLVDLDLHPTFARGSSLGQKYELVNELLVRMSKRLEIDLWTLHTLLRDTPPPTGGGKGRRKKKSGTSKPKSLGEVESELESREEFDPDSLKDARDRALTNIVRRRGQPKFRQDLLLLYGDRCAVTGCNVPKALEAAHIIPYSGTETNHPANGILLRADVHTLFDLQLISINPQTLKVEISPDLDGTSYSSLGGKKVRLPKDIEKGPSTKALEKHWKQFSQ